MPAPSIKSTAEALSVRFFYSAKRNKGEYDQIHPACWDACWQPSRYLLPSHLARRRLSGLPQGCLVK